MTRPGGRDETFCARRDPRYAAPPELAASPPERSRFRTRRDIAHATPTPPTARRGCRRGYGSGGGPRGNCVASRGLVALQQRAACEGCHVEGDDRDRYHHDD